MAAEIQSELLIDLDQLKDYEVAEDLSFYDFLKLFRFFILQAYLLYDKLIELKTDDERRIAHNSFPALYKVQDLKSKLENFASSKAVDQFLDVLSWDISDKEAFLDLQYHPIVRIGDYLLVQSIIMASSNIPRSIFISESRRGNNFKGRQMELHRPLAEIMGEAFYEKGFMCKSEVQVKFDSGSKKHGDIDFLAFRDGILFIAECKDATYPTDFFELRTTYNYVLKASSQIQHLLAALTDAEYLKVFQQQTGIAATNIKLIVPAIILSNRKFWGYSIDGIPVRGIKELISFVAIGKWSFKLPDGDLHRFNLWEKEEFQPTDIQKYCNVKSPHQYIREAMNEYDLTLSPGIVQKRYTLNLFKVVDLLKKSFSHEVISAEKI